MMKYILIVPVVLLIGTNRIHAQGQSSAEGIVWTGSKDNSTYKALTHKLSGVRIRAGDFARDNEVQVRATATSNYIEVKHKKTNSWLQMRVPAQSYGQIDVNLLSKRAFEVSNCDQVKTIINLTNSTPKTEIYFNSKPIGPVKDDGRFYYESGAICRNDKVDLVGTLPNCKDFNDSFKAANNPHQYEGKAVPDCGKKSAMN